MELDDLMTLQDFRSHLAEEIYRLYLACGIDPDSIDPASFELPLAPNRYTADAHRLIAQHMETIHAVDAKISRLSA